MPLDIGHFGIETEILQHIFTFVFCMVCDVNIIAVIYSKTCFSTNINLALANTKIVINAVRFAVLTVHFFLVQVNNEKITLIISLYLCVRPVSVWELFRSRYSRD